VHAFWARLPCYPGTSPALGSTSPCRRAEFCAQPPCSPGTSSALGSTSPVACAYSAPFSVLPGHVLSPWFGEPRGASRAFRARPPTQSVSCCSAVSLCRREVAQWMLLSVLENSGLITSCAAYPRDPARSVSSNHSTACPHAGYLQDVFNCEHQLINTGTLVTKNGPGNNFRR
jgi:hypothetical protein